MPEVPEAQPIGLRRIGRQGAVYALGTLVTRAVAFVMLPVYTRYLTPADYGIIQLVELTFDVISIVAGSRLAVGVFTFYHKAGTGKDRDRVLSTSFVLITLLSLAFGGIAFAAAPFLSDLIFGSTRYVGLFQVAAASFVAGMATIVPLAWLRLLERAAANVGLSLLKAAVQVACNVVFLVHFGLGPLSIVLGTLIGNVLIALVVCIQLVRQVGFGFSPPWAARLVRYGMPLVWTQVATFLLTFGDRYFLKAFVSESAVGLYALSYQFGFLLVAVGYTPIASVWEPVRFAIAKQANRNAVYARAFLYVNLLLFTIAVGISLFVGDVIRIMTTPAFHAAAGIVPIILAAYIFQSWYGMQDTGIHMKERTGYLTTANWVSGAVVLLLYWLLIPRWAGLGAAVATLIALALRWALTYRYSQRLWPVAYHWPPVLRLAAISTGVVGAAWLLPSPMSIPVSIPVHAGFLALYALAVWALVLGKEERELLIHEPRRLLSRLREPLASA